MALPGIGLVHPMAIACSGLGVTGAVRPFGSGRNPGVLVDLNVRDTAPLGPRSFAIRLQRPLRAR